MDIKQALAEISQSLTTLTDDQYLLFDEDMQYATVELFMELAMCKLTQLRTKEGIHDEDMAAFGDEFDKDFRRLLKVYLDIEI